MYRSKLPYMKRPCTALPRRSALFSAQNVGNVWKARKLFDPFFFCGNFKIRDSGWRKQVVAPFRQRHADAIFWSKIFRNFGNRDAQNCAGQRGDPVFAILQEPFWSLFGTTVGLKSYHVDRGKSDHTAGSHFILWQSQWHSGIQQKTQK